MVNDELIQSNECNIEADKLNLCCDDGITSQIWTINFDLDTKSIYKL